MNHTEPSKCFKLRKIHQQQNLNKHWFILLTLDIRKKYKSKNTSKLNDDLG